MAKTKPSPSATDRLTAWCAQGEEDVEAIVALLATDDAEVDAFLAGPARELGFVKRFLGDHAFEVELAVADVDPISAARWLALAELDPHVFAWNLEADTVLPLDDPAAAEAIEGLLLRTLASREDRSVLLNWLSHPQFLGGADAIARIEAGLADAGAALTWEDRLDTVKILSRRGGRWEAARALEQLLRRASPSADEVRAIHQRAVAIADATLLGVLGAIEPWASDTDQLRAIAAEVTTHELIEAFAPESGERRARVEAEAPGPAHRAAWRELALRHERAATDAVGRLIVRSSIFLNDHALAGGLAATLAAERREKSVEALVAAFLSGLHRRPPGANIERILRSHAEAALMASLDLQPDWVHTFEPEAMARLAFRLLPVLDAQARERVAAEAALQDGQRALILRDELDAL